MSPIPRGWRTRGHLPHADFSGLTQAVTFRLADALPASVLERLKIEVNAVEPNAADERTAALMRERIHTWLDTGHGSCVLRRHDVCAAVREELHRFDGIRYRLDAYVVMPNHVHVLVGIGSVALAHIVKQWKGVSARRINKVIGATGKVWQREYYDGFIRDEEHLWLAMQYMVANPVAANLVEDPWAWRGLWVREELRGGLKSAVRAD